MVCGLLSGVVRGAKLMEKVVPFIRGETHPSCQEGKNIGDAMMTVEIESESDVLAKTRSFVIA